MSSATSVIAVAFFFPERAINISRNYCSEGSHLRPLTEGSVSLLRSVSVTLGGYQAPPQTSRIHSCEGAGCQPAL